MISDALKNVGKDKANGSPRRVAVAAWVGENKQSIILFHHQALKRNVPSGGRNRPVAGTPGGARERLNREFR